MAIQISGTEVISNSRGLNNIASVDATTAASISAAGVGGGGTVDFTADGAISAGDVVVLNSDGTVSTASESTLSRSVVDTHTLSDANASARVQTIVYDSVNDKTVIIYVNNANNLVARVVTVTASTLSVGNAVTVYSGNPVNVTATFDPDNGVVVVTYSFTLSNYFIIGTVSGTTITFGSAITHTTANIPSRIYIGDMDYDTTANKVIYVYTDYNNNQYLTVSVGTVSGNSISFGTKVTLYTSTSPNGMIRYIPQIDKTAFITRSTKVGLITTSGTTATVGTLASLPSSGTAYFMSKPIYDIPEDRIVFCYIDAGEDVILAIAQPSGTSLSMGSKITVDASTSFWGRQPTGEYNANSDKISIYYGTFSSSQVVTGTVSNLSWSQDSGSVSFSHGNGDYNNSIFDSSDNRIVFLSANKYLDLFRNAETTSDNSSWIGISTQAISDTASGSVTVLGGVNDQQTGLTIGTTYYADTDGTLTATANNYKVGKAIAATDLLITEGNT